MNKQKLAVLSIVIPISLLHFVTGKNYHGPFPDFVNGYLMDILVPFAFYFLLRLITEKRLQSKMLNGLIVFVAASSAEILQYFHVPVLGRTFDPIDFVMYAIGCLLAVIVDSLVIARLNTTPLDNAHQVERR